MQSLQQDRVLLSGWDSLTWFFCWILISNWPVALCNHSSICMVIGLQLHKNHLLTGLPMYRRLSCVTVSASVVSTDLTVHKHLLDAQFGHFCSRSSLKWHLEWSDPPLTLFFNNLKQTPGPVTAWIACRNLQGHPSFAPADLLFHLVKYCAVKVTGSLVNLFVSSLSAVLSFLCRWFWGLPRPPRELVI